MGCAIKPLLEVVRDRLEVCGGWLDQVYRWDIGDGGSLRANVP